MFARKRLIWWLLGFLMCGVGGLGCGEQKSRAPDPGDKTAAGPPMGTWLMYGNSGEGLYSPETLAKEMSILVLGDSTYSLTFVEPQMLSFVESGKADYDLETQQVKFTVLSTSGVDWTGREPRKLVDVPEVVPWQRDPGVVYTMEWALEGEFLGLSAPGRESAYFKRLTPSGDGTVDISQGWKTP